MHTAHLNVVVIVELTIKQFVFVVSAAVVQVFGVAAVK